MERKRIETAPTRHFLTPVRAAQPKRKKQEAALTIHNNLVYSTPTVRVFSSKETILNMMQTIAETQPGSLARHERTLFNGVARDAMMAYYEDMYSAFNECGIGWWSCDWWVMSNDMSTLIAGNQQTSYDRFSCFDIGLLQLMQQYQSIERP